MPEARVTVVVPVWGAHVRYLSGAVGSLRAAGDHLPAIVVVDNASDPKVDPPHPSVQVVRSSRRLGVGAARNLGMAAVDTPYVMFWDADDLMVPGMLDRLMQVLEGCPETVAATMDSVRWTPESGPGERWPWPRRPMYHLARRPWALAAVSLFVNPFTTTGPALMRSSAVRASGGFAEDIPYFEDWALSLSLTVRGRIVMLRDIGRLYRVHDASLSLGHLSHPDQGIWLQAMRRRVRRDPCSPRWLRWLLVLARAHHWYRARRRQRPATGAGYYQAALESSGVAHARPLRADTRREAR